MTKFEMIYEIYSAVNCSKNNIEAKARDTAKKCKVDRVNEIYAHFVNDREHAIFYASLLG